MKEAVIENNEQPCYFHPKYPARCCWKCYLKNIGLTHERPRKRSSQTMTRAHHLTALRRLIPRIFARYGISEQWETVFNGLWGSSDATVTQAYRCYAAIARSVQ